MTAFVGDPGVAHPRERTTDTKTQNKGRIEQTEPMLRVAGRFTRKGRYTPTWSAQLHTPTYSHTANTQGLGMGKRSAAARGHQGGPVNPSGQGLRVATLISAGVCSAFLPHQHGPGRDKANRAEQGARMPQHK